MLNRSYHKKVIRGFYSKEFTRYFRGFFMPISRALLRNGISPNTVTYISVIFSAAAGIFVALDYLWTALAFGLVMSFSDIIDGQLAKEYGKASRFGAVLDSTIDRYNEFFAFAGLAVRYHFHGRELWIVLCALASLGSIMISYVKARAETEGFECKVGRLQRPERLTVLGIGVLFRGPGIDVAVLFLAICTQLTVIHRLLHVYRQSRKRSEKGER